ncbi:hypothetical protein [Paenibacillus caui]|uniref:hypothetical protein n=1 Tax=Paenibacillus caui TaxID=2873927 RepID=UPI001CA856D1|nr:hypothetical protein [Paenibacillus caui]
MSERLSRVKRLERGRKHKKESSRVNGTTKAGALEQLSRGRSETAAAQAAEDENLPLRSRRGKRPVSSNAFGSAKTKRKEWQRTAANSGSLTLLLEDEEEDFFEPEAKYVSRSEIFPSHRIKWTKWFFNALLVIFIALTVLLLWWGLNESPWSIKRDL